MRDDDLTRLVFFPEQESLNPSMESITVSSSDHPTLNQHDLQNVLVSWRMHCHLIAVSNNEHENFFPYSRSAVVLRIKTTVCIDKEVLYR